MCRTWIGVMIAETRTAWGIPAPQFQELGLLFAAAQVENDGKKGPWGPVVKAIIP
jgi:hypothetical protein